jgi:hypothetical protein
MEKGVSVGSLTAGLEKIAQHFSDFRFGSMLSKKSAARAVGLGYRFDLGSVRGSGFLASPMWGFGLDADANT